MGLSECHGSSTAQSAMRAAPCTLSHLPRTNDPPHACACMLSRALLLCRAKLQEEIRGLERAKNDAAVEQAFVMDKFRQMKSENDRLQSELDAFRKRLGNATEDYVRPFTHPLTLSSSSPTAQPHA